MVAVFANFALVNLHNLASAFMVQGSREGLLPFRFLKVSSTSFTREMGKSIPAKKTAKSVMKRKKKLKIQKDQSSFKRVASAVRGGMEEAVKQKSKLDRRKIIKRELKGMGVDELMEGAFTDDVIDDDEEARADGGYKMEGKDYIDITPEWLDEDDSEENEEYENTESKQGKKKSESQKHKKALERLKETDPEFHEFLKDHDEGLLDFSDEDNEDADSDDEDQNEIISHDPKEKIDNVDSKQITKKVLTTSMIDNWCQAAKENNNLGAVRSLLRAFRTACHYGDSEDDGSGSNLAIMTGNIFNKVMFSVLSEMDGLLRSFLKIQAAGGNEDTILNLKATRLWKNFGPLAKSYLSNALHILKQMTDNQMISFTIRRLRLSIIFLAAFPSLLRKYLKVVLHFWGTGEGALSVASFLFLRDMAIRLGSDSVDACMKGIYKSFIANCKFTNPMRLQHIQFLSNCVVELYTVDLASAYQHAFIFIRQLAMILRNAITMKTKESFTQVYNWKFMNCLDLWVRLLCRHKGPTELRPLAYPVSQIVSGVARLVPSARYFPLRLQCARMLNRLGVATETYIPVPSFLLDMLEFKELHKPPTGGIGKAVDFTTTLKVSKQTLKTRAFQEECISSVIEQLAEHLGQWSYSVGFPELAFLTLVRLRQFNKNTRIDRFRRQFRQLIDEIDLNIKYVGQKRLESSFAPKDLVSLESFLQNDRESGSSPLSKHLVVLRQRSSQRSASLHGSNIEVKDTKDIDLKDDMHGADEDTSDYGEFADGEEIFSKNWLPEKKSDKKESLDFQKPSKSQSDIALDSDVDIVETLEFSSEDDSDTVYEDNDDNIIRNYEDDKRRKENSEHSKKQGKKKRKASESNRKTEKSDKRKGGAQERRRPNKKQKSH